MTAPLLPNEGLRLEALRRLGILDTPPEERFDRITRLAALALNCPVSLVTFVDADRQWFKSSYGTDLRETPRDVAFCAHTILQNECLIIEDARRDPRFATNRLVTGSPHIRFYAGCPLHSADGLPLGSLCVIDFEPREFTARERALLNQLSELAREQIIAGHLNELSVELAESNAQLNAIIGNMRDALIIADAQGQILLCNRALERMLDEPPGQLPGRNIRELMPEPYRSDPDGYRRYLTDLRARGFHGSELARRRDGSMLPVERRSSRLRGTGGQRFIHVFRDLSERLADRRALNTSEQKFRDAFDNAPIGQALLALDGRYLQVNRALCRIVGFSSDELLGMRMQDLTHPDDLAADYEQVRRVRARQISTFHVEKRYFHKRGHIVWVSIIATISRDADGKALHYISQFQDITERREAEQVKSDFLATAAHELRSPLSSVYGFSELLLQKEFKPEKQRELLGIIHNQAQHMTRLINELLDLARMEAKAGRDFQMARHSPQSVVEPIVRGFLSPGREPATLQIAEGLSDICVDAEKTGQALTNILSNAFKYSPQTGSVDVRVEKAAGTNEVAIHVRDHGIGIAAAALPHVFERFYRVGNTSVTGTGLGMTLVKEIAERQGGRVSIDSEVGKWTEVTLFLPIADRQTTAAP